MYLKEEKKKMLDKIIYLHEQKSCPLAKCARHVGVSENTTRKWYAKYLDTVVQKCKEKSQ